VFLSSTLLFGIEAHLAKSDAMQLAAIVTMQTGLAHIYCNRNSNVSWLPRFLFWLGPSVAMLIKGPVAPTVATMTLGWLCWKEAYGW
jgi:4-amino-4-deoxy-L-arabinose transferase-like glycosyltransferase